MKKKGFTEAQIILFTIIAGIILLVLIILGVKVGKIIKGSILDSKKAKIINASKEWLNNIENKYVVDGKTYYVSTGTLVKNNLLKKEYLTGCVKIVYQESNKDYTYSFNDNRCENIMDGKDLITSKVVSSGDGLYEVDDDYTFKGSNPNNYIKINDKLYRILSIDKNGIKIITNDIIEDRSFDSAGIRTTDKNSYCTDMEKGCNAYTANSNDVTQDSEINQYLETAYYNSLKSKDILLNNNAVWNIGMLPTDFTIDNYLDQIKSKTINGNIELISVGDYINASTNKKYNKDNWLNIGEKYWTLTSVMNTNNMVWYIDEVGKPNTVEANTSIGVRPVLNINTNIKLTGEGTKDSPYILK